MFRRPRDYAEKRRRIDRFGKKTSVCDDFFHFSPILEKAGGKGKISNKKELDKGEEGWYYSQALSSGGTRGRPKTQENQGLRGSDGNGLGMKCIKQGNIGNNETADMQESSKAAEWGP